MTVEIVAGRLLAPFIGVSLLAWASVIGVVMVAMALGYAFGGRLPSSSRWVAVFLGLSGLAVASMPFGVRVLGGWILHTSFPLWLSALFMSAVALCLPAFFLATIYPLVVRLVLSDLRYTGETVGVLNAAAAVGSIVGTILTGFVWLMWFSVSTILWVMAIVLGVLGIGVYVRKESRALSYGEAWPQIRRCFEIISQKRSRSIFSWWSRAVAFLTGFTLMSVEVIASRALAPYVGVSVYTWTGIITAVLVGVTLGNMVGGLLADREASRGLLGRSLAWSGVALLVTTYVVTVGGSLFGGVSLPLVLRIVLFALLGFFPPALVLSTISPQLAKMITTDKEEAGLTVGALNAWNTLGGLLGTLATGFFLISVLGTRGLLWMCALLFLLLGSVLVWPVWIWRRWMTLVLAVLAFVPFFLPRTCKRETQYFCIQIYEEVRAEGTTSTLRLDHLVHSYVRKGHPEELGYGYEQVYAHLIASLYGSQDRFSSFFIGGGGYVLPRYLEARYPQAESLVSEIDPGVTEANHKYLYLSRDTRVQTVNQDARLYLLYRPPEQKFDLVFGDAFNDFSVPYHLTTLEFHQLLKTHMSDKGVYALNIIDDARYGKFLSSMMQTLRAVWKHVYVAAGAPQFTGGRNTIVLIATDQAIDPVKWRGVVSPAGQEGRVERAEYTRLTQLLSQEQMDAFIVGHPVPILRDDFVPTDRYLAPVFSDAY